MRTVWIQLPCEGVPQSVVDDYGNLHTYTDWSIYSGIVGYFYGIKYPIIVADSMLVPLQQPVYPHHKYHKAYQQWGTWKYLVWHLSSWYFFKVKRLVQYLTAKTRFCFSRRRIHTMRTSHTEHKGWNSPDTRPTKDGVYLTALENSKLKLTLLAFQYWNGKAWCCSGTTFMQAYNVHNSSVESKRQFGLYWKEA